MKEIKKVVAQLLKEGAEKVNGCVVKNVHVTELNNYTRVSLTLNKSVKQMVTTESGDHVEGEHNVVFASSYSIGALLGENEDTAFAKNRILASPKLLEMLLSYSVVDLVLEPVKAGTEYVNPFSNKTNAEPRPVDYDTIYTHIVGISLGKKAMKLLDKMENKMLDEAFKATSTDAEDSDEE